MLHEVLASYHKTTEVRIWKSLIGISRWFRGKSSHPEVFCKKDIPVHKVFSVNFAKILIAVYYYYKANCVRLCKDSSDCRATNNSPRPIVKGHF